MTTIADEIMKVLRESRLCAENPDGGWMRRSNIVAGVYGEQVTVNAHHRGIFKDLVRRGVILERHRNNGFAGWFEYKDAT